MQIFDTPVIDSLFYSGVSIFILAGLFTCFASFYGVLLERGFRASLWGRSHCDSCQKNIIIYQNIPIFSALWLLLFRKGKTNCCEQALPLQHLQAEVFALVFGALAAVVALELALSGWGYLVWVAICLLLLYSAVEDIWYLAIDVRLPLLIVGLMLINYFFIGLDVGLFRLEIIFPESFIAAAATVIAVVALIIGSRGKGLGVGDVYWYAWIGLSLGAIGALIAALITIFSATFYGLGYALAIRKFRGVIIPLVPFILLGWMLTVGFQDKILGIWWQLVYF